MKFRDLGFGIFKKKARRMLAVCRRAGHKRICEKTTVARARRSDGGWMAGRGVLRRWTAVWMAGAGEVKMGC
jgi:hypothetical protein